MSSRIIIKSVSIQNFRSIKKDTVRLNNTNIFVGLNDAGKSNYLKALNLFFNNETDYKTVFDFQRDFTHFYNPKSHEAKTISIELELEVPDSFKDSGSYLWKKSWRVTGNEEETIERENKQPITERSRALGALRRMKYRYVPAVKSKEFFKSLLSDLYFTASTVIDSPLESSMESFTSVIQTYTEQIHNEVGQKIGIDSKLAMPADMSDMFRALIFETSLDGGFSVPLDMRGDGIQARHIPIILKYIADRDKETRSQGTTNITTIWGYEEPENGVELSKAFEMAYDFREYASDIQMLITTHSPAFYGQSRDSNNNESKVLYITQNENGTKSSDEISSKYLSQTMGLMTLVAPYVEEQKRKLDDIRNKYAEAVLIDIPTIFVEGKTDKAYLETAIHLFSEKLDGLLKNRKIRVFTKDGEGGCGKLIDFILAWILSGNKSKAMALFDKDKAGIEAKKNLCNNEIYKDNNNGVAARFIKPSDTILELYQKEISIPYEIEHLLSADCWKNIIAKNWTQEREYGELSQIAGKLAKSDRSVLDVLSESISDKELFDTIVLNSPGDDDKKIKIQKYVIESEESLQKNYLEGFRPTIEMIESFFTSNNH